MRVVIPYAEFAPDSPAHRRLGPFDWQDAIHMLRASLAEQKHIDDVVVLTDLKTVVPGWALRYATEATRLQLWLTEIRLAYLRSPAFDQDTILISPDTLIVGEIAKRLFGYGGDMGLLVRPHRHNHWRSILNSVQWWRYGAKPRLIDFYQRAYALAASLPEGLQGWGADTETLRQLLFPITHGVMRRGDLNVAMVRSLDVFMSISSFQILQLEQGHAMAPPTHPIFDFKGERKHYMRAAFDQLFRQAVAV